MGEDLTGLSFDQLLLSTFPTGTYPLKLTVIVHDGMTLTNSRTYNKKHSLKVRKGENVRNAIKTRLKAFVDEDVFERSEELCAI
jgi:hypothetical protein